ncbi:MAG: 50S ribosomal protein L9 [Ignavibacteriales bacterium]|nr:50S ribosomal protein L9 [Ignavibacteriales bacterium]
MKVILRQNIESLGQIGHVVSVKDGYARNYLIPRKYAYLATAGNILSLHEEKKQIDKVLAKEIQAAQKIAAELEKVKIQIPVQVGEEDKLFGSVTSQMIVDALTEKGQTIDKRKVELAEPIKALGVYSVGVKLHSAVTAKVEVWVVRE